jgi:hypothetical protein
MFSSKPGAEKMKTGLMLSVPIFFRLTQGLSRKEDRASGVHVVFLVVQCDVRGARLYQQDLILLQVLVPRNQASGRNVLGAKHEVFRAAVLWSHSEYELVGRGGQRSTRTSDTFFPFVLFEHSGAVRLCAANCR